ncbi:MAG: hypothetical protein HKN43_14090 [Rhodothermales bacterium]|nr:hypothetical protein [Rhodothermales bacterium]
MDSTTFRTTFLLEAPTRAIGFSRVYLRFVAIVMLPLMIVTLFAALEGSTILPYLYRGYPGGLLLAFAMSYYWMRTVPAMVIVDGSLVEVRTVHEAYYRKTDGLKSPAYVIDLDQSDEGISVTVGLDTYTLKASDWQEYDEMKVALQSAHLIYQSL